MKLSHPLLAILITTSLAASSFASAQSSAAASGPKSRAEVKGEVKAARASGETPPDVNQSQIGDPPVPKARKPKKVRTPKSGASASQ